MGMMMIVMAHSLMTSALYANSECGTDVGT